MLVVAALFLIVVPFRLHAQAFQGGTWFADPATVIYSNRDTQSAKVMVTVWSHKGSGSADMKLLTLSGVSVLQTVAGGTCQTVLVSVRANADVIVVSVFGGTASGTYSISTPLGGLSDRSADTPGNGCPLKPISPE